MTEIFRLGVQPVMKSIFTKYLVPVYAKNQSHRSETSRV